MHGKRWTEYEDGVMVQLYESGGPEAVLAVLTDRTKKQISQHAWQMTPRLTYKPHLAGRRNGGRRVKADAECAPYPWPPISKLDRLGFSHWGYATKTDQPLRPMVRVELEEAA
jgi:hypothetical protein